MLKGDQVKGLYEDSRAGRYNRRISHFNLTKRKSIERSKLSAGDSVIVFCCGTGLDFPYVQKEVGLTGKITGLDFSPNMIKEAERLVESEGWNNVELVEQDILDLDGRYDSRFDAAVCTLGLSIIPEYEKAYRKLNASVRVGGQIIIGDMKLATGFKSIFNPLTVSLAKRFGGSVAGHENILKIRELMRHDLDDVIEEDLMLGSYIYLIGTKSAQSE